MSNQHKVYTVKEEVAHALTHGIGAVLSIVALVFMLIWAAAYGDGWHVVAASIYGASLILLYTASTLYHAFPWPKMKAVFQQLDHAAIYILIAGTYTPFALINLRDAWGWTLLGVAWGIALVGVVLELTLKKRIAWLSLTLYLGMGWMAIIAINPMIDNVDAGGLMLLVAGGLAYTLGVIFYVWKSLPYHHAIWHLFVLAGSVFHFFSIFYFVLPQPELLSAN
ncbi:hemolysin III family protein [Idiomarina loihiensis]|jgi:hemolysin III|uniref:Hemolysin III-like protein n=1 Tax=Idiomarina loihiensis (strain ATCC BAA-735 / DSM 15497 / L2-TR) TaxID=283942 RepID=Q5QUX3_IDILO|nr:MULTISPECIES: hemolysin III family protein [Idiomarina]NWO03802.1 hemolysin III family protein [Idiomarinaceae bacterium]AAV83271.1 hemolysin III-like protein [Idiomarina loihiensis L2TR]AGM37314.1 hemolysin III-like protein [Idiomarina loihiensis GSL 199]MAA62580.1 hemolysin III [Idiomarina sp.]MBL4856766.1 hemolysin III family protein [Idiomarina sp.]|tara:strand:+ start:6383 stop:7051 length:669 start_codon:yes stop_codon:yes gene_type:complete